MGLAITFWPFGGKATDAEEGADADMDAETIADEDGDKVAQPSFRQRLSAWWEGTDPVAAPAPDSESDSLAGPASDPLEDSDSESDDAADQGPSFLKRLHAWWEGYDLADEPDSDPDSGAAWKRKEPAAAPGDEKSSPIDLTPPDPAVVWSKERIILSQAVWGEGLIWPGGLDYIHNLVNGLPLNPKNSMLEIGAGLGGASREMVEKFGAYITAKDRNPALVAAGNEQNITYGVDEKVAYESFDPAKLNIKENYFVAVLMRDALLNVKDKNDVLTEIIRSMKVEGQIMMTDFLFDDGTGSKELEKWREAEIEPVYPWALADMKKVFQSNKVVMRITEDESESYHDMARNAWNEFMHKIKKGEIERDLMGAMLWEADLWARRLAALEAGSLRYYRVLGVKGH